MTNDELHALAAVGVTERVGEIEKELATYHHEWPELFLHPTVPPLLKASTNGQPDDPAASSAASSSWRRVVGATRKGKRRLSAATRAKLSAAMKLRHTSGLIAKAKRAAARKRKRDATA